MKECPNCGESVNRLSRWCSACGEEIPDNEREQASLDDQVSEQNSAIDEGQASPTSDSRADAAHAEETTGGSRVGRDVAADQQPHNEAPLSGYFTTDGAQQIPDSTVGIAVRSGRWLVSTPLLLGAFLLLELFQTAPFAGNGRIILFIFSLSLFALAYQYAAATIRGDDFALRPAVQTSLEQLPSLVGIFLVYIVLVFAGTLFFILPGLYLAGRLSLAMPACILDDQNVFESFSTSWNVAGGHVSRLLVFVIPYLIGWFDRTMVRGFRGAVDVPVVQAGAADPLPYGFAIVIGFITAIVQLSLAVVYLDASAEVAEDLSADH